MYLKIKSRDKNNSKVCYSLKTNYITPNDVNVPSLLSKNAIKHPDHNAIMLSNILPPFKEPNKSDYQTLDGFLLLESSQMAFPDDARKAIVTNKRINHVIPEDLSFFTGLIYLDVSENFLDISPFGVLPRLKFLKCCYNNIINIKNITGFEKLIYLDLSYNRLTLESVQNLDCLPSLKELDLCGNDLRSLPIDMYRFASLEKLLLEHNKIADNDIFPIICTIPRLEKVDLSYNFLSHISSECCSQGYFNRLEEIDLSFNYFSLDSSVLPLFDLNRLKKVILYGNPLLGPTGEDPLQIYVEDIVNLAQTAREGSAKKPVEIITEIPKKRRPLKKGEHLGRHTLYKDFDFVYIEDSEQIDGKNNYEWKQEGNQTLFAEAVAIARKQGVPVTSISNDQASYTFLTAPINVADRSESEVNANRIAENVMGKVAGRYGLNNTAEILEIRDRSRVNTSDSYYKDTGDDTKIIDDKIPPNILTRNLANSMTLSTHPVTMNTALNALRFAINNPLTDYNQIPSKGFLPPHNYVRSTNTSKIRQLPKVVPSIDPDKYEKKVEKLKSQKKFERGISEPTNEQIARKKARDRTLQQIEDVLDNLNQNTKQLVSTSQISNLDNMRGFAKPKTGIDSIVQMVNEVVNELAI